MFAFRTPEAMKTLAWGAALSVVFALPGFATTMKAVYSGPIRNISLSVNGEIPIVGSGSSATMTFIYDTTKGLTTDIVSDGEVTGKLLFGGKTYLNISPFISLPSPIISASLTIYGASWATMGQSEANWTISPNNWADVVIVDFRAIGQRVTSTLHRAEWLSDDLVSEGVFFDANLSSHDASIDLPLDLTQPFSADVDPQNSSHDSGGTFQIISRDPTSNTHRQILGGFAPTRVVVTRLSAVPPPAAVPLPPALSLLAVSLGGLAIVARRRRSVRFPG